ncbi:transposable element Tcb1 transposase [Trichonephila clavipes]|nr:transposable element Tcb1 transposase [Trichonephila clavipes]
MKTLDEYWITNIESLRSPDIMEKARMLVILFCLGPQTLTLFVGVQFMHRDSYQKHRTLKAIRRGSPNYSGYQKYLTRGSVTAVQYRDEVLDPIVNLFATAVGPSLVLMGDNARPQRAAIVDDFLESEEIARIEWPAYSPDLNPFENLWDVLSHAVCWMWFAVRDLESALQEELRLWN